MGRLIKVIDNETIEIADYRCSAVLYPEMPPTIENIRDQIRHCEDWCVFRRTINPFQMCAENEEYQQRIGKAIEYIKENSAFLENDEYEVFNKKELLDILEGSDKE